MKKLQNTYNRPSLLMEESKHPCAATIAAWFYSGSCLRLSSFRPGRRPVICWIEYQPVARKKPCDCMGEAPVCQKAATPRELRTAEQIDETTFWVGKRVTRQTPPRCRERSRAKSEPARTVEVGRLRVREQTVLRDAQIVETQRTTVNSRATSTSHHRNNCPQTSVWLNRANGGLA
jgi:hypothetical protein